MRTLKSAKDFERVFKEGKRASTPLLRIKVSQSQDEGGLGRVAFVAAKRLGNAVYRNRCKRLMREAARSVGLPFHGWDMILFATDRTHGASPDAIADGLVRALGKVGVGHGER